jgi:hypothetical protein
MQQALSFPETTPNPTTTLPLLLCLQRIVHCRAVEDDPPELTDPILQAAMAQGLLDFHAPAPLGEDRERFMTLARDLQERRDDYAAQLGALSLAAMSENKTGGEGKSSIISTLLDKEEIDPKQQQQEMLLWQARLVLALGEQFDRDQMELRADLEHIRDKQEELLDELRREEDTTFSLTSSLQDSESDNDAMIRLRLKAWSHLFALGDEQLSPEVFVTSNRDAVDLLREHHQSSQLKLQPPMVQLALPATIPSTDYLTRRDAWMAKTQHISSTLFTDHDTSQQAVWKEHLQDFFPAAEYGRRCLELYRFSGCDPQSLFLETFGRSSGSQNNQKGQQRTFWVGLLT